MAGQGDADCRVKILQKTFVALMRSKEPNLTLRQLGVMLIVCLTEGPHTVTGLAHKLCVSKPAMTKIIDRLCDLGLARRGSDRFDLRIVNVLPTLEGADFLEFLRDSMNNAALK